MGSYIQIDSISIDLSDSLGKRDAGKCDNFSIRGYVSEICQKDWKTCWPFPVPESDRIPSPPAVDVPPPAIDVPEHRCLCCQNCHQENAAKDVADDQTNFNCCSTGCRSDTECNIAALKSGTHQEPVPDILRPEIDLNTNLNFVSDCLPISNDREKAGIVRSKITGCDGNEVSNVELASNLKCMDESSVAIKNGGKPSSDNQCCKELIKACTILGEGTIVMEADNITGHHTPGYPPPKSVAFSHTVPAGNMGNLVVNDFEDHHLEKSTGLSRRRPRKVRLMTDLLSENGELKIEQFAMQGSAAHGASNASAASHANSNFPGKVGDQILTNIGQSRKGRFLPDDVWRPAVMNDQRFEIEVQKLDGGAQTIDTVLGSGPSSIDVLQDAAKANRSKPEIDRSHTMGKNKKIQVADNHLILKPDQGRQRENEYIMDPADQAYTSKTLPSRLSHHAFSGKGVDHFPFNALRADNEFNLSKVKGKTQQTYGELDSLSHRSNAMVVEDSFACFRGKLMSNMHVANSIPSPQGALNGKGLDEGLHLSLNSDLAAQVYNKKCIHQIENRFAYSLSLQEGTSKAQQRKRKGSEVNFVEESSCPSKHKTSAISGKGLHREETTHARNTLKTDEGVKQVGIMKRYSKQTAEVPEQGSSDDIPMEIVELLAKNQYERCLPDVENKSCMLEKSTVRRKAQMITGSAQCSKVGSSVSKETQKEKPQGRRRKNNLVMRGENMKPSKNKPVHYYSPFDGNILGMNNLCPPQSSFGFEVSHSQKTPSSVSQFSPMGSSQLGSSRNCKFNGSLEQRGSSNAVLQTQGGCSLHKTILQQDDEASRIWASLTPNHVPLGYAAPKHVSQPASGNMNFTSLQSAALHKQNMKRHVDRDYINLNAAGLEKLNSNSGPGTFSRMSGEYPFPCKHNGIEPHQNLRGSLDLYSNETIPAMHLLSLMDAGMQSRTPFNVGVSAQMQSRTPFNVGVSAQMQSPTSFNVGVSAQMPKRPPTYPGDCNTKLAIGTSKSHGTLKRRSSDIYFGKSYLSDKPHGCFLGSPTIGATSSSQHDRKIMPATGFNSQNSTKSGKKEKTKSPSSGKKEKIMSPNTIPQNRVSKQFSRSHLEAETPLQRKLGVRGTLETSLPLKIIPGNSCVVNRNPWDFTMPCKGNVYMIRGRDLKFEKSIPKNKPRLPAPHGIKQQRKLKGPKTKEHSKH